MAKDRTEPLARPAESRCNSAQRKRVKDRRGQDRLCPTYSQSPDSQAIHTEQTEVGHFRHRAARNQEKAGPTSPTDDTQTGFHIKGTAPTSRLHVESAPHSEIPSPYLRAAQVEHAPSIPSPVVQKPQKQVDDIDLPSPFLRKRQNQVDSPVQEDCRRKPQAEDISKGFDANTLVGRLNFLVATGINNRSSLSPTPAPDPVSVRTPPALLAPQSKPKARPEAKTEPSRSPSPPRTPLDPLKVFAPRSPLRAGYHFFPSEASPPTSTPSISTMVSAPPRPRSLPKQLFSASFSKQKTQSYVDPSHTTPRGVSLGGSQQLRSINWNLSGTLIATGSPDRVIRIWNPEKPNAKHSTELRGSSGAVEKVVFAPGKEAELASVGADGTLRIWDVRTKAQTGKLDLGDHLISATYHPAGDTLLVGTRSDTLHTVDLRTLTTIASHKQNVQTNQAVFSWSGQEVFLTTGVGEVKICDWPDMREVERLNANTGSCYCVELDPAARYLAVGGSDALITLWDTADWTCRHSLASMTGPVRSLSFSFDGSFVVGGSDEGSGLEIAHVETGEYVHSVGTSAPALCVAWHPLRYWLAYSCEGMGLKIMGAVPPFVL